MKNFRNYFKSLFNGAGQSFHNNLSRIKMFNNYTPWFTNWDGDLYEQNIIRSCIHIIASHTAKLTPKINMEGVYCDRLARLKYLLENKPNEYMNRIDFFYKTVSMLYSSSNTFIYTRYDKRGNIMGFYPVNYRQVEFWEYQSELIVKFAFNNDFDVYIPYSELIHIRRYYNDNELFGSGQEKVLKPVIEAMNASNESMINAVRATGQLRGYLKFSGNFKEEDLKRRKEEFVRDYMSVSGDSIGALDTKTEFIPLEIKPVVISERHQRFIIDNVCMAYGVSEALLKGDYNEEQYNSFYNNVIEHLADLLSLCFTNNIFTEKEIISGAKIVMSADKMTFANNQTRTNIIKELRPLGILTANQCMKIMELPEINEEWADKHIISLNYVEASKANDYQGVNED